MSDSGSKGNIGEITEAIVKPVVDEVGKMVEVGVQSITGSGPTQDPQEQAKKKVDEQKRLRNVQNFIQQMQANEQRLAQQKIQKEQTSAQQKQEENQEKQIKQFEVQEKKKKVVSDAVLEKMTQTERRKGVGG